MPVVSSTFRPPPGLGNGHVQTILPVLLGRKVAVPLRPERLEMDDGDFLDLEWLEHPQGGAERRLAIITHGLEGTSAAAYVRGTAACLHAMGWDTLAWNFRGCSREMNRLLRLYHSGDTGDLRTVIAHAAATHPCIALIGFSLGGNVTLKYLGEGGCHPSVQAGVAISVPIDLAACARRLDGELANRIYLRRFLQLLTAKIERKARAFPEELSHGRKATARTFQEFDDRYTAPLHGFRDAADYWARSSSRQFLPGIRVPTLLLNARNDPFLAPECFPWPEAEASACLHLEAPASGGHVGFLDLKRGLQPWYERRTAEFLAAVLAGNGQPS